MKAAILYASSHGKTRKVVAEVVRHLHSPVDVINVRDITDREILLRYSLLLFFCPTYGDEELQEDMEEFFRRFDLNLTGIYFCVCELGSYYGYEDFSFGAMRIIRAELLERHAKELCLPLSIDSFPRMNEQHLLDWVDYLNGKINEHSRSCYA